MAGSRFRRVLRDWFKTTGLAILAIASILLLLVAVGLVLRVSSFEVRVANVWLLSWQNPPGVPFALSWNGWVLLLVAVLVGLIHALRQLK